MADPQFYVEIVAYEDDTVQERRGPFPKRRADKIDDGLNINLNHEAFYTRVVIEGEGEQDDDEPWAHGWALEPGDTGWALAEDVR